MTDEGDDQSEDESEDPERGSGPFAGLISWFTDANSLTTTITRFVGSLVILVAAIGGLVAAIRTQFNGESTTPPDVTTEEAPDDTTEVATGTQDSSPLSTEECATQLLKLAALDRGQGVRIEVAEGCSYESGQFVGEADVTGEFDNTEDLDAATMALVEAGVAAEDIDFTLTSDPPVQPPDETQPEIDVAALAPVLFDVDNTDLSTESQAILDDVAAYIGQQDSDLAIHGHADAQGSAAANLALSQERAEAARDYLVGERGVAPDRVTAIGFGEGMPVDSNSTETGRAANRRVELVWGTATNHTVVGGDTLWGLADTYYADGARWPEIQRANRAQIEDPNVLVVGTEVIVPPTR